MPIFTTLIEVEQLATAVAHDADGASDLAIIDCRFDLARPDWGALAYAEGHIPGALYGHLDRDLSGPVAAHTGRHPLPAPEQWTQTLSRWGVDARVQVVAYDQGNGAYAARLWWLLRWAGHRQVAVLNGGFAAWQQAGMPVDLTPGKRTARSFAWGPSARGASAHAAGAQGAGGRGTGAHAADAQGALARGTGARAADTQGALAQPRQGQRGGDPVRSGQESMVVGTAELEHSVRAGELLSAEPMSPPGGPVSTARSHVGPAGRLVLVDARSADRFAGQNETIDPVAGHIPGARNYPFVSNLDSRGRFLPADELRKRWGATLGEGAAGASHVIAMCGSGVTACHNLLALEIAGLTGARLYAGSWSEWIRDPRRPIA